MIGQKQRIDEINDFLLESGLISALGDRLDLPPDTRISYFSQLLSGDETLLNAVHEPIDLTLPGAQNVLLLVDPDPQANWAHPCWVVAAEYGENASWNVQIAPARYPPLQTQDRRLVTFTGKRSRGERAEFSVQINTPLNRAPVTHLGFSSDGDYEGTDGPVLIECVLNYTNPPAPPFTTGRLPPEDPAHKSFLRQFLNVLPTMPGQVGLLTAFLYDGSGQNLLAQSTTIQITIT
jgi:hypothetical protein